MATPRFIYSTSDGLTSTTQIALKPIPDMDGLWQHFLVPFYNRKTTNTPETRFLHEEIMDHHECKLVRKVKFVYNLTPESEHMFKELLQFENPDMSILIALVPIITHEPEPESPEPESSEPLHVPCIIDTATNEPLSVHQLYYDEPSELIAPYSSFKYMYVVQKESAPTEHYFLKPVNSDGVDVLFQMWQRLKSLYTRAHTDPSVVLREKHEIVDHVDCGKVLRFFLHYDDSPESLEMLYNILETRREGTRHTLRVTLVPKTPETETLLGKVISPAHYPCLVNAATRTEQRLPLPAESYTAEVVDLFFSNRTLPVTSTSA